MLLAFAIHWLPYYWSDRPLATGPRSLRLLSANLDCFNPALTASMRWSIGSVRT